MWYLHKWAKGKRKLIIKICFSILVFGIITAYTRAAYVAVAGALAAYWVIRLRLTKLAIVITLIVVAGVVNFLIAKNMFMEFAPSENTVAHTGLNDIVSSTSKLEDVSTMERYYRWIAGVRMIAEKPIVGFGPGNFHQFYKQYTLDRFSTYVSDNPEKSGIHNYYLMVALEQGIVGLIIFVFLVIFVILYGEKVYHASSSSQNKDLVMAALLSTIIIDAFLMMNDMIETDKVGSFFFFNMAIVVLIDTFNKKEKALVTPVVSTEKPLQSK
jgi:O-antigen ligase